jgi:hypothetical protein
VHRLRSSTFCNFLQPPIISPLFSPSILLSILFSNTLSVCSPIVRDQDSHKYKTTLLDSKQEDKSF